MLVHTRPPGIRFPPSPCGRGSLPHLACPGYRSAPSRPLLQPPLWSWNGGLIIIIILILIIIIIFIIIITGAGGRPGGQAGGRAAGRVGGGQAGRWAAIKID